mgnify:CR=1 FL=1
MKKPAALLCIFVLGFILGLGIKFFYETKVFKAYTWRYKNPVILNCYGPDFSEINFIRAISYWTMRGFPIGFYEHNPPAGLCGERDLEGFIILRKATPGDLSSSTLASTTRRTSGTSLLSAEIIYSPNSFNLDLLNEHELGHALGFSHIEIEGHVMHPEYSKMSSRFWMP